MYLQKPRLHEVFCKKKYVSMKLPWDENLEKKLKLLDWRVEAFHRPKSTNNGRVEEIKLNIKILEPAAR